MLDTTFALVSAPALVAALLAVPLPERAAVALDLEPIVCISEAATLADGLSQGCDPFALPGAAEVEGCTAEGYIEYLFPHLAAWGLHTGDATTEELPPPVHPDLELTWGPEDDLPF